MLSKFHPNTYKSPNIKVVQFFKRHNFAFRWHCKFVVDVDQVWFEDRWMVASLCDE
jgi:hypothetical protein